MARAQENLDDLVAAMKAKEGLPMIVLYGMPQPDGTTLLDFTLCQAYENSDPQLQKDAVAALGAVYQQLKSQ